jgi:hypothetical protein
MNDRARPPRTLWLSFPLAFLLAGASLGGLFLSSAYQAETGLHAAQAVGNDAGNLLIVVPVLVLVSVFALRRSRAALLVWMGALLYLVYDFLGYAFGLHFNAMFLAYCAILGLSFYALAGTLPAMDIEEPARRYASRAPAKVAAVVLLLMAAGTVFHWLAEDIPALIAGQMPQAIRDAGQFTDPVAFLDLAFGAPACMITAILLLRRKPLGFFFGPILLTFLVLSSLALVPIGIAMDLRGFKAGYLLYAIAFGIAAGSSVLLAFSLRESEPVMPSE